MGAEPERQARFIELVQTHLGVIRKVAALYARHPADRDDLFQEIVVQLWQSFDRFRGDSAFSTCVQRDAVHGARQGPAPPADGRPRRRRETHHV